MEFIRNKVREGRNKGDIMKIGYIELRRNGKEWR